MTGSQSRNTIRDRLNDMFDATPRTSGNAGASAVDANTRAPDEMRASAGHDAPPRLLHGESNTSGAIASLLK